MVDTEDKIKKNLSRPIRPREIFLLVKLRPSMFSQTLRKRVFALRSSDFQKHRLTTLFFYLKIIK